MTSARPHSTAQNKNKGDTALVLSGGGARGAYEVGVISGIFKALENRKNGLRVFNLFCGTSVGALNAAWLAANAHKPKMAIEKLISVWKGIDVDTHLKTNFVRFLLQTSFKKSTKQKIGYSLLDVTPFESIVSNQIDWNALHKNTHQGIVQALIITALDISTGQTTMFTELAPGQNFLPSRDIRRIVQKQPISAEHILASSAIPLIFPARKINNRYYCDGGLRFNTPIAPAIRAGANKLVIIPLLFQEGIRPQSLHTYEQLAQSYPSPIFLLGKVLNALLLDPVNYDLQVLQRFNQLLETFEHILKPHDLEAIHQTIGKARGMTYRPIQTLVIKPSDSLGHLASEHIKELERTNQGHWLLKRIAKMGSSWESDFLSFVLFDRKYIHSLIQLGEADAKKQEDEILEFFFSEAPGEKQMYSSQYPPCNN